MMANFHRAVCQRDKAQLQKPQTVIGKYFKEKLSASTVVPLTVRSSNVLFSFFKQKWNWIRIYVLNFYQVIGHQNLTLWGWVQLFQQICGEQSYWANRVTDDKYQCRLGDKPEDSGLSDSLLGFTAEKRNHSAANYDEIICCIALPIKDVCSVCERHK